MLTELRTNASIAGVTVILVMTGQFAAAEPLALVDRNGSQVSIEGYAPNIVRVTLALDTDLVLAPPGSGIVAAADATGWQHRSTASGMSSHPRPCRSKWCAVVAESAEPD